MPGTKLLVVDDQVGITKVMELIAREAGMQCRTLNKPARRDATEAFIEYRPNVLILDMIMPQKDGIDVLNDILLTGIPTKIVVTSCFSDAYLRLAAGVAKVHGGPGVAVLRKPFRRDDFISLLSRITGEDMPSVEAP